MERFEKEAKTKTVSIWTDLYGNIDKFRNPFYKGGNAYSMLTPNCAPYKMRFWEEYFLKWNNSVEDTKILLDEEGKGSSPTSNNMIVKSALGFYQVNKLQSNFKEEVTGNKVNDILRVLVDVYEKTKNDKIFEELDETTKFYLSNLNSK